MHHIDFNLKEQKSPEFLLINPMGQVPAITHEGFNLSESGAILTYLAEAYNITSQWYPPDLKQRALINWYLHWHHTNTRKGAYDLVFNKVTGPLYLGFPELSANKEHEYRETLDKVLQFIDKTLETTGYIAKTPMPSMADIQCFCELAQLKVVRFDFSAYPAVERWRQEMEKIPEIDEVHQTVYKAANPHFIKNTECEKEIK